MIPTPLRWEKFDTKDGHIWKMVLYGMDAITVKPSPGNNRWMWEWGWHSASGFKTEAEAMVDAVNKVRDILFGEAQRLNEVIFR